MAITLSSLDPVAELGFDEAIDVRSPSEFAEDHLPGAVNLPVLDDAERARVGTIYVQESRFLARRIGAALVARNAARHLEGYLASKPAGYRPLVYCWRGGQRSGSFATILGQIGWRVETIDGGYRSWRRLVQARLYEKPFPSRVVLLDGNTGTAKTRLLARLAARGVQTIDLEGLANHRGSIFGARAGGQPSQKMFEGRLALIVDRLDPARPVVIEAESSRVGALQVPPRVWQAMRAARRVEIVAPLPARARYLAEAYADITADPARLDAAIAGLAPFHDKKRIARWHAMAAEGAFEALAAELMEHHYDPRYQRQRARLEGDIQRVETPALDEAALGALADRLAASLG